MSWPCRLVEKPPLNEHGNVAWEELQVGDMWFLDLPEAELRLRNLSAYYWANNAGRKPLVVKLPGPNYFLIDGQCFDSGRGFYDGWTVSGTPPCITVQPSINLVGRYHGWLQNGVISDDCEGRNFGVVGA